MKFSQKENVKILSNAPFKHGLQKAYQQERFSYNSKSSKNQEHITEHIAK